MTGSPADPAVLGPAGAPATRACAVAGVAGAGLSVVLVGVLHVLAPEVDPVRRTISEYALGPLRPLFDLGVLGLAAGSALVLVAAVRARIVRAGPSAGAVLMAVWAVALVVVVAFEKTNAAVGPSVGGYVHRYASLVAFACLPAAALVIGRGRRADARGFAAWCSRLGALVLVLLGAVVIGVTLRITTGVVVWSFLPLGLVERALALVEVTAVVLLGTWAYRANPIEAVGNR